MLPGLHIVRNPCLKHCLVEIVLEECHWIAKYYSQDGLRRYIMHKDTPQTIKPYSLEQDVFYGSVH